MVELDQAIKLQQYSHYGVGLALYTQMLRLEQSYIIIKLHDCPAGAMASTMKLL